MSESYGNLWSTYWTGKTGRALRGDPNAQLLGCYLISSPHASMIGAYYLPVGFAAHETGLTTEQTTKALGKLEETGFAFYDHESEFVFVTEMGRCRVGKEVLNTRDKRWMAAANMYLRLPPAIKARFFARYGKAWELPEPENDEEDEEHPRGFEGASKGLQRGIEGPSKPVSVSVSGTGTISGSVSESGTGGTALTRADTFLENETQETARSIKAREEADEARALLARLRGMDVARRWTDPGAPDDVVSIGQRIAKLIPVTSAEVGRLVDWQSKAGQGRRLPVG